MYGAVRMFRNTVLSRVLWHLQLCSLGLYDQATGELQVWANTEVYLLLTHLWVVFYLFELPICVVVTVSSALHPVVPLKNLTIGGRDFLWIPAICNCWELFVRQGGLYRKRSCAVRNPSKYPHWNEASLTSFPDVESSLELSHSVDWNFNTCCQKDVIVNFDEWNWSPRWRDQHFFEEPGIRDYPLRTFIR